MMIAIFIEIIFFLLAMHAACIRDAKTANTMLKDCNNCFSSISEKFLQSPKPRIGLRHSDDSNTTAKSAEVHRATQLPVISFGVVNLYSFEVGCA